MNVPIPDWKTHPRDYWIMRYCRGSSTIAVFLVGPILQITTTRIMPFALAIGLLILLLGHGATRGRYFPVDCLKAAFDPSTWSTPIKWVYTCYLLFLLWMTTTLFWSPLPVYGARDILLLLVFLPLVQFVAMEQATNSNREFAGTLVAGVVIASLLLILELDGVTNFLKLASDKNHTSDLNRNAAFLAMLCWTPILFVKNKRQDMAFYLVGILVVGIAVYLSKSESAKVGFLAAMLVGILIKFAPSSAQLISIAMALMILAFPFILPKIEAMMPIESQIAKQGHAHHRFAIWLGYAQVIQKSPIVGSGVRADRYLGLEELARPYDPEGLYAKKITSPHNFILEIWVNFGAIGAFLLSLIILGLERLTRKLPPLQSLVSMQVIVTTLVYSTVGSSFLQGWWVATVAIAIIVLLVAHHQSENAQASALIN